MSKLTLTPGPDWERYTRAREGLTLLGVVREGAAVGALALRETDGRYVQVNGDFQRELGTTAPARDRKKQPATETHDHPGAHGHRQEAAQPDSAAMSRFESSSLSIGMTRVTTPPMPSWQSDCR